jgi:hypothetical protein
MQREPLLATNSSEISEHSIVHPGYYYYGSRVRQLTSILRLRHIALALPLQLQRRLRQLPTGRLRGQLRWSRSRYTWCVCVYLQICDVCHNPGSIYLHAPRYHTTCHTSARGI